MDELTDITLSEKEYMRYNFIYIKVKNRQNKSMWEKSHRDCMLGVMTGRGHEGDFWSDGDVYPKVGGVHIGMVTLWKLGKLEIYAF